MQQVANADDVLSPELVQSAVAAATDIMSDLVAKCALTTRPPGSIVHNHMCVVLILVNKGSV